MLARTGGWTCGMAVVAVVLALGASVAPAAGQEFGRVTGRAIEAESGQPLEGASVVVRGTSRMAVTDGAGRFLLLQVPVGTHTIELTYIGRETQTQQITVRAGEAANIQFSVPVAAVTLEAVTALGARAMVQAEALNRQKTAPNIMNIVASDQIGRFPDASAPEAVQRLPGVAVARDQGEGRYIQIRGGSAANTQVSFNGIQVPSPEGDERQIALDAVPVDILESIEVSKALLPYMDADAIGGAVNLVTRRAPVGRLLTFEGAGGYATIREQPSGSGSLTYGNRTDDGRFGFLLSGSYSRRSFGSDDIEPEYDLGAPGPDDDVLEELSIRHYSLWRARIGGTATLDYRPSENTSFVLTGIYSELQDEEQRRNFLHAVEDDELQFRHKHRREDLTTYNIALTGDHLTRGGTKLDFTLAFTRSLEHTPFDSEIRFVQEDVSFSPDLSDGDRIRTNPAPGAVEGAYEFNRIEPARSDTRNTDLVGGLDLTVPFRLGADATGTLRFGAKLRDRSKDQDVHEMQYRLVSGASPIILGQSVGSAFGGKLRNPTMYPLPPFSTTPDDLSSFPTRFSSQLRSSEVLEEKTNNYELNERVAAGYVMSEVNLTPSFLLVPGVRFEHTKFTGDGFEFDSEAETLTPSSGEKSYGRFFPMIHARYGMGPNTNLRAAFTTAIARPNYIDLVPFRLRDDEDLVIGNPDLDPTMSRNFDLLFEHYDSRIGVISAGIFYKQVTDPIFIFVTPNELGGETRQPRNGESAWIRGIELAVQQQLSFLPAPFDGLGIYANYTYTGSEATLPGGRVARLQGQADHVFNTALSYEKGGFSGQVSMNYHADFVNQYGGDTGAADETYEDIFTDRHLQLDASASLRVTPRSTVFLELVNLTNEPFRAFQGISARPVQVEYYERWARLGIRFSL